MQRTTTGILLGGILITGIAILFRMGDTSEPQARRSPSPTPEPVRKEERILQTRFTGPTDLLAFVDPSKDAVSGRWHMEDGALACGRVKDYTRLQVPCIPPAQYDLEVQVERRGAPEALVIGLPIGDRQVVAHFDGKMFAADGQLIHPLCSSLRSLDGQSRNETLFPGPVLREKGLTTILLSVRTAEVQVVVDDLKIIDFRGDLRRMSVPQPWKVPSPHAIFVGAFDAEYRIVKMSLRPLP